MTAAVRDVFDALANAGGGAAAFDAVTDQPVEGDNYFVTDPVDSAQFGIFLHELADAARVTGSRRVLVAGCGTGLETELLADRGFDVVGFDFSPGMVEQARARVGGRAELRVLDVLDVAGAGLGMVAGVVFSNVAPFLEPGRGLLRRAVKGLTSPLLAGGAVYLSTTLYPDPVHTRTLDFPTVDGAVSAGRVTYYARPIGTYRRVLADYGVRVKFEASFDSGDGGYRNQFLIGRG